MKVDINISFHRRQAYWPLVSWGLIRAKEHIRRVIVVNDEPWGDWLPIVEGVNTEWLVKPPNTLGDFNYSAMINEGVAASETEYAVHMDDDVVLQKDTLPRLLTGINPERLHAGTCYNVKPDVSEEELLEREGKSEPILLRFNVPQTIASGPLWACQRLSFMSLGGFDERLVEYADQDGEFVLRWLTTFGYENAVRTNSAAYQIEPPPRGARQKPSDPYYYSLMTQRLSELRRRRGSGPIKLRRTDEG